MPSGDRTGPWGRGPRTGRGLGFCSGYDGPGYDFGRGGRYRGRGMGYGRGYGRGFGRGFGRGPAPYFPETEDTYPEPVRKMSPEEEKDYLKGVMKDLENEMVSIKTRMKELQKK